MLFKLLSQQKGYIEKLIIKIKEKPSQHVNIYTHLEHSEQSKGFNRLVQTSMQFIQIKT